MPKEKKPMKTMGATRRGDGKAKSPEWATGLRRLYDSVVDEPLPDSFAKLLDQLDDNSDG
ncbi:NepR family anti-sigma factor [Novosphingobium sp. KCTC 2891]|nr:NepR family anti-sigma factor [Novosphingobium sp. KCTC 2891]